MCFGGGGNCSDGVCAKCHAVMKVVLGALVLLNIYVWPSWGVDKMPGINGWLAFFAVLFIIKGAIKFVMPNCSHCKPEATAGKKGK
ncbi:hypothetical protein HYV85_00285 [Candidatus Woesearchaeota archaeon]|nr:hypothetical protein [Candidatus Woesearchaeota archaeon]